MDITFDKEHRLVKIGDDLLEYRKVKLDEVRALQYFIERAVNVYETLEKAKDAFEGGKANYENAGDQVRHLIDGSNSAAAELVTACAHIDKFFAGSIRVSELFAGKGDELLAFCRKFIEVHHPDRGLLGNSSRARTGSSRRARPKIAECASDSSCTRKEGSPAQEPAPAN